MDPISTPYSYLKKKNIYSRNTLTQKKEIRNPSRRTKSESDLFKKTDSEKNLLNLMCWNI